jgi:signal transduction histidine kinase
LGADVPGFAFPLRFRVELSDNADFTRPTILLDASKEDYPNPGNNPVVIPAGQASGQHLRIIMLQAAPGRRDSFGLSEIEVFSQGQNIARNSVVSSTPDRVDRPEKRPASLIVDGHTSYGRLLPLPQWLERWQTRRQLQDQLNALQSQHQAVLDLARNRAWTLAATVALILPVTGISIAIFERRSRKKALRNLRNRLAQDLHDEIGSNIAGIAMISETSAAQSNHPDSQKEDLLEINRIAQETTEAMREVLWLIGARAESGPDFIVLLQRTVSRLLTGISVHWTHLPEHIPGTLSAESRRQIFLFFKEALTNISRHAHAKNVILSLQFTDTRIDLNIEDDGHGFDPTVKPGGLGLTSMKQRARSMNARMTLHTAPNTGTKIHLTIPL